MPTETTAESPRRVLHALARTINRQIWLFFWGGVRRALDAMVRSGEPRRERYRYAQPRLRGEKLARLRIKVTGKKRKTGDWAA